MTFRVSETFSSTTEQSFDRDTGKQISSAHSTETHIKVELPTSTPMSLSVLPAEYREIVYRLLQDKKG
jgi:hypothetical protein